MTMTIPKMMLVLFALILGTTTVLGIDVTRSRKPSPGPLDVPREPRQKQSEQNVALSHEELFTKDTRIRASMEQLAASKKENDVWREHDMARVATCAENVGCSAEWEACLNDREHCGAKLTDLVKAGGASASESAGPAPQAVTEFVDKFFAESENCSHAEWGAPSKNLCQCLATKTQTFETCLRV